MNNHFDELTKNMARSVTRRAALKRFSVGLAGLALACLGLTRKAEAQTACLPYQSLCKHHSDCCSGKCVNAHYKSLRWKWCA